MKTFLNFCLLANLMVVSSIRADSEPTVPTEFTYVLESRQTNRYAAKCGWRPGEFGLTNCCPSVEKYYGIVDQTTDINLDRYSGGECSEGNLWWSGILSEHQVGRIDRTNCQYSCESATGTFTAHVYPNDEEYAYDITGTLDCTNWTVIAPWGTVHVSSMNDCSAAEYQELYFYRAANCDLYWWGGNLVQTSCSSGIWTNVVDCNAYDGWNCVDGSITYHVSLSEEFTTPELIAMVKCAPTDEWVAVGGKSYVASASIAGDESSATMNAADARFKVWAPEDEEFEIPYVECRTLFTNGTSIVIKAQRKIKGTGNGSWQYFPVSLPVAFSTHTDGSCTLYHGEDAWIEVGCANNAACSTGSCGVTPGTTVAQNASVHVTMGLGATSYGAGQASLKIVGARPNANLTSPAGLELFGDLRGATVVRSGGQIQQVKSLYVLANVVVHSPTNYSVEFYDDAPFWGSGPFDTTGYTPISTNNIRLVDTTNHIRLTISNGTVYDYYWSDADQGWTLVSGGGQRKEIRTRSESPRIRAHTIKNSADAVVFQEVSRYVALGTNYYLAQREIGASGSGLTNLWFYYDNPTTDGTNYGKIKLTIEPSGYWRRYQYDEQGRLTNEVSQFLNVATNAAENLCRVVRYDYTSLDGTNEFETRIELLQGIEIAREYTAELAGETRHIRCIAPGAAWTNADNLVTITRLVGSGEFAGKTHSVISPDGTMQLFEYNRSGGQETTTVYAGEPNSEFTAIVKGTKSVTTTYEDGRQYSQYTYDLDLPGPEIGGGYNSHDDLGRVLYAYSIDGTSTSFNYDCCGLESTVDRDGVTTTYVYDALRRQIGTIRNNVLVTNLLDAVGNVLKTIRVGGDGSTNLLRSASYDTAGRITGETNALDGVTSYATAFDGSGQTVKTTTFPDNGQRIETYYQDGSLKSVTGSAAFPVYYDYGAYSNGTFTKETKGSASGSEWVKTYSDLLGRSWKTEYADGAASTNFYNAIGQLEKSVDPDGVTRLYTYNGLGQTDRAILDLNRNGVGTDAVDRITRSTNDVVDYSGSAARRSRIYQTAGDGSEILVSERLTIPAQRTSISLNYGLGTTNVTSYGSQQRTLTVTQPDGSQTVTTYTNGLLAQVQRNAAGGWPVLSQTDYAYDSQGRQHQIIDARNGATTYTYNAADQMQTVTTPSPDGVATGLVTTTYYDKSLRATNVVHADNTSTRSAFFANGLLQKTWGSRIYPVEYQYDHAGRMTNMLTWQDFNETTGAGISGSAATKWLYDTGRGWLNQKKYADNTGPSYTYTAGGRLKSRAWVRGVTTWYTNNNAGELAVVNYTDTTPDVTNSYDRRGRLTNILTGATSLTKIYTDAGSLLRESYTGGPLNGVSVTNGYDVLLRRTNVSILNSPSSVLASTAYGYDAASRLLTVSDGVNSATYDYLDNSALVEQIVFATNGTTVMTTTKGYDFVNRLTNTTTLGVGLGTLDSHVYKYNTANQRTSVTNVEGSYWVYSYDSMGQVLSGKKYWSDNTPVAGQQFDYSFDDIGNRKTTTRDTHSATYTPNTLNQYISRTVPNFVNVIGTATNTATVSLWSKDSTALFTPTTRKGDYFRGAMPFNNATGAMWLTITNVAVISNYTGADIVTNIVGNIRLAKNLELFTHDADGNLTSDSLWTNVWNGENRRITVESRITLPAAAKVKEEWAILADGRWIERIVSTNNGTTYYSAQTNRYVWDNQVLLAVLDHTNGVVVSFLRGLDLSSTLQGAGGVGGVLAVGAGPSAQCETMANTTHFTCYDGNGNVTALMNAATGEESARYERGPFAESVRETSPMAKLNPIRFNTQYADDVNGDMKYLFRDYQTQVGRWPSRDPIGELGERNIYAFVGNDLLNWVDLFGLYGGPFSWPSRPDPRPPQRPPDPDPPYNRPVPLPNPAKDTWRICCQPVTGASLVTHCDLRWYPCDFESSVEYPVTRNPKCCNKTIKSDYDMKKCFAKQSQGGGYLPWNNCQVDAWNALQNCCGKTRWTPSWYILQGGCPSEYITAP